MYRIRSTSGTEAVYSSLEEFNVAVRRGAVAADDEIFHTRANRWLDVKSHPHYRLALSGTEHNENSAAGPSAGASQSPNLAPPPRSMPTPGSAPLPQQARPQAPALDRPMARPVHTIPRPQVAVDAVASAPSQAPAAKSKDLTFVDLGTPSQRNATVIETRKAPSPPPPKVEPKRTSPGNDVEFLVMDGGIESPVRTSAGHRTVPEDLDLLFDTPLHSAKPPAPPPAPPKAKQQAAAQDPIEQTIGDVADLAGPKPVVPRVTIGEIAAPRAPAPRAATPAPAVAPRPVPATAPVSATAASAAPRPAPLRPIVLEEDLTIPGALLMAEPTAMDDTAVAPAEAPEVSRAPRRSLMIAGIAVLAVAGGLGAWRLWAARSAGIGAATHGLPVGGAPAPLAGTTPPAVPGKPVPPTTEPAPSGAAGTPESAPEKPADERIVAAAKPNFRTNTDIPTAVLGLGGDLQSGGTPVTAIAPRVLTQRLETAEKLAQLELGSKLGGFRSLFIPSRLATSAGVAAARTAWSGGADAIRQYRARIARMEMAYEDSVLTSQRSQRWPSEEMRAWAGHQSQAEPVETSQLTDLMISQVDEGLDILASLDGKYEVKGATIVFKNPASGTRYTSIRSWVEQRTSVWSGTPESARPYSVSAILRAIGDGLPAAQ